MQSNGQNMRPALDLRPPDKILNQIKNALCWPTKNMANRVQKGKGLLTLQYYAVLFIEGSYLNILIFSYYSENHCFHTMVVMDGRWKQNLEQNHSPFNLNLKLKLNSLAHI